MTTEKQKKSGDDIPAVAAVVLVGVVLGGLFYFKSPATFIGIYRELDRYSSAHGEFLSALLFSVTLNGIWICSVCSRLLGVSEQGKRLEILTGKGKKDERLFSMTWLSIVSSFVATMVSYFVVTRWAAGIVPIFFSPRWAFRLSLFVAMNYGFTAFVVASALERSGLRLGRRGGGKLPSPPKLKNTIVIGSEGEESATTAANWVAINRRALNGNILITGSIGWGKTQGTILPFLDQILANFEPKPAILALDPKGTFITEARKIIRKHGLEDKVLHLTLDGDVTFNPIYVRNPLKNSAFLEVAHMIRSAAANHDSYAAKQDSAFWENSSFHLIRGALVYCAAVTGYYTLKDLYSVLVRAEDSAIGKGLLEAKNQKLWEEEEKANIAFAIEYFDEEYHKLEQKVRTSILATATSFLNQFQEYQAARIFCPSREQLTLLSMDEVIEQGKILLFDVGNPGLSRSMGTFIKLHYEGALLKRLKLGESTARAGLLIIDEYQDVVSVGSGGALGDGAFLAKGREGNTITIAASQSLTSIENAVGRGAAVRELVQNFRTRIAGHSGDLYTIRQFQELAGQVERPRESHSVSEMSHHASRNLVLGGFEAKDANISESFSTSAQKEYRVTGGDFASLRSFEAFSLVYDGVETMFKKLFLKPYFLVRRDTAHVKVLEKLRTVAGIVGLLASQIALGFPNVCTVVKTDEFRSCLNFSVGACMCPGIPPRPCAKISYYVPQTFVEVMPDPKSSYFGSLPGAALQLGTLGELPYGTEADTDSHSFQAHTIAVPFASVPFSLLPCGGARFERFCFDGMSEHLGMNWSSGQADLLQPNFLAWSLSPKACLLKGAATSVAGGSETIPSPGGPACSIPMSWLPKYPPSSHEACNGWGLFYPRSGTYAGPSQTIGALMIGSRIKSLSSEVFHSTPGSPDERWQMISPQSSSCFREGQNAGLLETVKGVRELGRLTSGKLKGHLFVVWSKVDCCRDFALVPEAIAVIEAMIAACQGVGAL